MEHIVLIFDRSLLSTIVHVYAEFHEDRITARGFRLVTMKVKWVDREMHGATDDNTSNLGQNLVQLQHHLLTKLIFF